MLAALVEREARAVSSLNHPHICMLHDVGQQDGVDYIVMELLEGQTLLERLEKGGLPTDQCCATGPRSPTPSPRPTSPEALASADRRRRPLPFGDEGLVLERIAELAEVHFRPGQEIG